MNFYKRHLGDIAKSCGDLSQGQMGAYDLLLDWHYANEKPLPLSTDKVYRIGRAVSKFERDNVDSVLAELFIRTPDGYIHKRAAEEMAKANAQADTNRRIAEERESRKRARNKHDSSNETSNDSCTNRQPSQTPDSRLHKDQELSNPIGLEVIASADDLPAQGLEEPTNGVSHADRTPIQAIVAMYHAKLPNCRKCEKITPARAGYIRQRWREDLPTIEAWGNFFDYASQSAFLMGRTPGRDGKPPFVADLEFLTKPSSFVKIAEGKYHQ